MSDKNKPQVSDNSNENNQDINENPLDLSNIIDELINLILKEINEGKEERAIKKHVLNYINKHKIILQEIYDWLLNNQNHLNTIYLLGYFNYHGIETNINFQNAFELYQKAAELGSSVAQFNLTHMYIFGKGIDKDYNKAFELSSTLAGQEYPRGMNLLGYCYELGVGTNINKQKASEFYQKGADLGNNMAQYNLARMYRKGDIVNRDYNKAFELCQKSAADGEYPNGIHKLGCCYDFGIGTSINKQKAVKLYQKAANLEHSLAQYKLANMCKIGEGIVRDIDQAIYWYKKQENRGNIQDELEELIDIKGFM
jgi:TPR repeat protein